MTLHQKLLPEKASDSEKQHNHMSELAKAIDAEHKENQHQQENCLDDCEEHDL